MLAGCEIRRRGLRVLVSIVLVGVVGATVLATLAGARRSDSALARFQTSSRAGNLELTVGDPTAAQLDAFGHVHGVAAFAPLVALGLFFPQVPNLQAMAGAVDTRFGTVVDRVRVIEGREADPRVADELTIGEALAAQLHLRVGDHLDGSSYSPAQVALFQSGGGSPTDAPDGPTFRLHVVGIVRRPLDLGDRGQAGGVLVLTPAFTRQYGTEIGSFGGTILRVRTQHGAGDVARVAAAARRIFGQSPQFTVQDLAIETQGAQNAIDVLTVALWVFAGVALLAGVVAIAIVLGREISFSAADQTTHRALGLTRVQRIAVGGFQTLPIAVGGAVIAVVGAVATSPLFPVGAARRAEPDPGFRVDGAVLALGALAILVGITAIGVLTALRMTRRDRVPRRKPTRPAMAMAAAARAGAPPVATTGVRMAFDPGRGATSVPVRSAVFGAIFGVLGVVSVFVFASSLDHLAATPRLYGWTWDFAVAPTTTSARDAVPHVPGVAAAAEVLTANVQLDGRPVNVWGYTSLRGHIGPEITAGRAPSGRHEVALGAGTLHDLHKRIGDTVHGEGPDGAHDYRIVGRAVFPRLDTGIPQPLANGAAFGNSGLDPLLSRSNANFGSPNVVVRVASRTQLAAVEQRVAAVPDVERPFGPSIPVEVDRLRQIDWLPVSLAGLLALLALLATGHSIVTGIRRRRHDLAVLKTLGFDRRQVRASVAWQATALACAGLVVGIPAGLITGSLVWRLVAHSLGVAATAAVPALGVVLIVPAALVAVNVVAFLPARAAARTRPAVALRSE
jgi:hypothetical protein